MNRKTKQQTFRPAGLRCPAHVVDVYDGDTITVEIDLRCLLKSKYYVTEAEGLLIDQLPTRHISFKCRMAGYNSAELRCCSSEEKAAGIAARDVLRDLILDREVVCHFLDKGEGQIIPISKQDPYGRSLVDIYLPTDEGTPKYINLMMINSGHAAYYNGEGEKKY